MRRVKATGICLVAVFGIGALAATSALALPEVGRCVATSGGKYADANCVTKAKVGLGQFEFMKGAEKKGFTLSAGETLIEGAENLDCKSAVATGRYDEDGTTGAIKGVEDVILTFHGCSYTSLGGCNSAGRAAEEIVTEKLAGGLGYISGEKTKTPFVGQQLEPEVKNGAWAVFECGGGAVKVVIKAATSNCLIAPITPPNVSSLTFAEQYKASGSVQEPQHFQSTPTKICQWEATFNGGAPEKWAIKMRTEITNEEALEIRA